MLARLTVAGTRSTSGDGTAVIGAPGAGKRVHVFFVFVAPTTQGAEVTATIKSGTDTLLPVYMGSSVAGFAGQFELVAGEDEDLFVNLSAAEEVAYSLSYRVVDA